MKRVVLLVLRRDVEGVIEEVASLGVLHLLDHSERAEWSWGVRALDTSETRRRLQDVLRRIEALIRFLGPPPVRRRDSRRTRPRVATMVWISRMLRRPLQRLMPPCRRITCSPAVQATLSRL